MVQPLQVVVFPQTTRKRSPREEREAGVTGSVTDPVSNKRLQDGQGTQDKGKLMILVQPPTKDPSACPQRLWWQALSVPTGGQEGFDGLSRPQLCSRADNLFVYRPFSGETQATQLRPRIIKGVGGKRWRRSFFNRRILSFSGNY